MKAGQVDLVQIKPYCFHLYISGQNSSDPAGMDCSAIMFIASPSIAYMELVDLLSIELHWEAFKLKLILNKANPA